MHILFVAPYPPSRIRVRAYSFISYLARTHDVKALVLCTGQRERADVRASRESGLFVDAVEELCVVQYVRAALALCSSLPLQVAYVAAPAWMSAIEAELRSGSYDLLHIETLRALGALPRHLPVPVVYDLVDCISHLYELGARAGVTPLMRTMGRLEARRVRLYEQALISRFTHVLVSSERERQKLLHLLACCGRQDCDGTCEVNAYARMELSQRITVLPNGVDQAYFAAYHGPRQAETLVFSGKLSYHANVAAVLYLVKHILPRIWCRRPAVRLILVGCDPPLVLRRLACDPRIVLVGYVADIRPYIAQAEVAVCPLPYAVGVQNKVLEAMALGTPVVASSWAVAGLQAVAGRDLLVADHPDAFASAVLLLLDNRALRQRLVTCAFDYVANNHRWENLITQLLTVYEQALSA